MVVSLIRWSQLNAAFNFKSVELWQACLWTLDGLGVAFVFAISLVVTSSHFVVEFCVINRVLDVLLSTISSCQLDVSVIIAHSRVDRTGFEPGPLDLQAEALPLVQGRLPPTATLRGSLVTVHNVCLNSVTVCEIGIRRQNVI